MQEWEYTTGICVDGTWDAAFTVEINKVGGGTLGRKYAGLWEYRVSDENDRTLWFGTDLNTGTAKTHQQIPLIVAEFFAARESGCMRCPCCGDDAMTNPGHSVCSECWEAQCEPSRDRCGELGYWECSREMEDEPESGFVATMNVPGYIPMDDDPPVFETTGEAWSYLAEERERAEDETGEGEYSGTYQTLRENANNGAGIGVVYGDTPGYTREHDLGMAYCVTATDV